MKKLLKAFVGANRMRVIAVIGITRDDVIAGLAHALTANAGLPVHAWCAEVAPPVDGCDRFIAGADAGRVWRDLRSVWPALCVVSWTGAKKLSLFKLAPLAVPPFRVVAFNESGGFFAVRPVGTARHLARRLRDLCVSAVHRFGDWLGGAGQWIWNFSLALLAAVAQLTPPLARYAVRRAAGKAPVQPLAIDPARDTSYAEVAIPNRSWPYREARRLLQESRAQFIVFRLSAETADPAPLIQLAAELEAFAVARQSAWSRWRAVVAHKHPFRPLQPGEVAQVAAPYSTLIAIRRDLLLRAGLPKALTFGGALLTIFRVADAAGWKSFVIGHNEALTDEPAMALEDAELALRVTCNATVRQASALHRSRTRGNVGWSPAHSRPFRDKPRILVVSPYLPFPLAHGGAVRIYNLCRALSSRIDFVLACFREAKETVQYAPLHEIFRQVYVVDADEEHRDAGVPAQVAEYRNSAMSDLVTRLCLEGGIDLLQLEYTQMAEYRTCAGSVPVLLVEHDITFTLHSQFAHALPAVATRRQYELWLTFEREALKAVNTVWTMSEHDRAIAVEHGASSSRCAVVPNGVDLVRFQPLAPTTDVPEILFVGSFRHLPNLLAFEALRNRIMPAVWEVCPDAKLHVIAGPGHLTAVQNAKKPRLLQPDPRIRIEGFVDDVRPAYRECRVVVIPLPVSAGTNIKLMEAMACGRAVVSTPVGCRGIHVQDSHDLLIRDIDAGFAQAITLVLSDEALRRRLASNARQTAEACFDWNSIARTALESYVALTHKPVPEDMPLEKLSI